MNNFNEWYWQQVQGRKAKQQQQNEQDYPVGFKCWACRDTGVVSDYLIRKYFKPDYGLIPGTSIPFNLNDATCFNCQACENLSPRGHQAILTKEQCKKIHSAEWNFKPESGKPPSMYDLTAKSMPQAYVSHPNRDEVLAQELLGDD